MSQKNEQETEIKNALLTFFQEAGLNLVEPPLLQPAGVFLELAGEQIRNTLLMAVDQAQSGLCLRPDFTIPICRYYLQTGDAGREGACCYYGPVFRQGAGKTGELIQAGVESLGNEQTEQTDGDILSFAIRALRQIKIFDIDVIIGDQALFSALLEGLSFPSVWKKRLVSDFGDREKLYQLLELMRTPQDAADKMQEKTALPFAEIAAEDLFSLTGMTKHFGRRTGAEIIERYKEKTELSKSLSAFLLERQDIVTEFLNIKCPADRAPEKLEIFTRKLETPEPFQKELARTKKRLERFIQNHIDLSCISFHADFGRRLDYYTGFAFEITPRSPGETLSESAESKSRKALVGGGRYDMLATLLESECSVPCVGFCIDITATLAFMRGKTGH